MKHVLTIAGSDSSGGAGIQGDLKTIVAHGIHGLSVITAITAQSSVEICCIEAVLCVEKQIKVLEKDIPIHGVKIGMLYSMSAILSVSNFLSRIEVPVVIDPLMYSTTGKELVTKKAMECIKKNIIPKATLVTPNRFEASYLSDIDIQSSEDEKNASYEIYKRYGTAVLLKGGHSKEIESTDILWDGKKLKYYRAERINAKNTHGTGCCLSSAITCELVNGKSLEHAIQEAKNFITEAITHGYAIGQGVGPVDQLLHRVNV